VARTGAEGRENVVGPGAPLEQWTVVDHEVQE
jgi:hypothetical protein